MKAKKPRAPRQKRVPKNDGSMIGFQFDQSSGFKYGNSQSGGGGTYDHMQPVVNDELYEHTLDEMAHMTYLGHLHEHVDAINRQVEDEQQMFMINTVTAEQ